MNFNRITNLATPVSSNDGATKEYVDTQVSTITNTASENLAILNEINASSSATLTALQEQIDAKLSLSGGTMTGSLNLNNNAITNLAAPVNSTDAIRLSSADARYLNSSTRIDQLQAPAGDLSMNSYKITSLGNATSATDALNR